MLPYRDSRLTRIFLVIFFLLVAGYAYYEGRGLLWGPTIEIENRVMEVRDPFITIEGSTRRILTLSMNGMPISVTEGGAFAEPYVLAPGYNRIVLSAEDRWGKTAERAIEIIYTPSSAPDSAPPSPKATEGHGEATTSKKASEGRPSTSAASTSSPASVAPEE